MNDQPSNTTSSSWPPIDRKVWVPVIMQAALILTFVLTTIVAQQGFDLPIEIQGAINALITAVITVIVGAVIAWLTPMTRAEVKGRMDNSLVKEAEEEGKIKLAKVIDDTTILTAQLDDESVATIPEGETKESLTDKLAAKLVVEKLKPENTVLA